VPSEKFLLNANWSEYTYCGAYEESESAGLLIGCLVCKNLNLKKLRKGEQNHVGPGFGIEVEVIACTPFVDRRMGRKFSVSQISALGKCAPNAPEPLGQRTSTSVIKGTTTIQQKSL